MKYRWQSKDPADVVDYGFDWSNRLEADEKIVSSIWELSLESADRILVLGNNSFSDKETETWVSEGTAETRYVITNKITTDADRLFEASAILYCLEQ